jgi:hypothetical protein
MTKKKKTSAAAPRKTSRTKTGIVDAFAKAGARDRHPHLDPLNSAAFAVDRDVVLPKASNLLAYQRYLADARAVKAKRKGASVSFERSVLTQARQARDDLDAFTGAAMRMTQQVNQTDLWSQTLASATQSLRDTGPITPSATWAELMQSEQISTALATHGVSPDIAATITDAFGKLDATVSLRDSKVSIETQVAGESQPRRVALASAPPPPADLSQLLRRSQFDGVMSALTTSQPIYIEAVPAGGIAAYQAPELFAFGVVAARQHMNEHVRKLEDTGLATYEGNDPFSFILALIVIGLFLALVGTIILELCDRTGPVLQPDWLCTAGGVMVYLALIVLGALVLLFIVDGVAVAFIGLVALVLLLNEVPKMANQIFPDFQPGVVPP